MRVLSSLIIIAAAAMILSGCNNYGKEYKLDDRHNIYYKGNGVDEALAKKLANYLKEEEYFQNDITATVQLVKEKDTFHVNFVVDKSKIDEARKAGFTRFGGYISKYVFDKAPVSITLTDDHLEPFVKLGYTPPPAEEAPVQEAPAQ